MVHTLKEPQYQGTTSPQLPTIPDLTLEDITRPTQLAWEAGIRWEKAALAAGGDPNKLNTAVDYFLAVGSQDSHFRDARMHAFTLVAMSANSSIPGSTLAAFLNALPCCLYSTGQLIQFNKTDQAHIDTLLCEAIGIKVQVGALPELNSHMRLVMMKYALIKYSGVALPSDFPPLKSLDDVKMLVKQGNKAFDVAWVDAQKDIYNLTSKNRGSKKNRGSSRESGIRTQQVISFLTHQFHI